jgi:hypothetical protein
MDRAVILTHVPDADPVFVELVSRLPDPPAADRARILDRLSDLHRLFLEKRRASDAGDESAWNRVVDQEVALISSMEGF